MWLVGAADVRTADGVSAMKVLPREVRWGGDEGMLRSMRMSVAVMEEI